MERLKNDLEGEVNNSEKLNNALSVSKALVNNLNTKYAEAVERVNHNAKTFVNLDKASKALKKAKEEVGRLKNKNEESQKTITKLRETLRFSFPEKEYNKLLQEKYQLEKKLQETDQKASLDEVFTDEEKNTKLSELNTQLLIALNKSKEKESATSSFLNVSPSSSHLLPRAKGSTPKPLSKKELKKWRQKTKKKLVNMQAKEAEDIPGDDDNLLL
jgi:chromosome segregation ATPase